jgi:hypothetical protein
MSDLETFDPKIAERLRHKKLNQTKPNSRSANMNIFKTELFPYIDGASLIGKTVSLTMTDVITEELAGDGGRKKMKYTLGFEETDKRLVLNKTNAKTIATMHGGETEDWQGSQITLYSEPVQAFGKSHNVVRVAPAKPVQLAQPEPASSNGHQADESEQTPLFDEAERSNYDEAA